MLRETFYDWGGGNVALFRLVNDFHNGWWDALMRVGTWTGDYRTIAILMALSVLIMMSKRADLWSGVRLAANFLAIYLVTSAVVWLTKTAAAYPRPAEVLGIGKIMVLMPPGDPYSFPSGHAARAAMLVGLLWPYSSVPVRIGGILFVLWVSVSRVSVGAHFPADVLFGAAFGAALACGLQAAIRAMTTTVRRLQVAK